MKDAAGSTEAGIASFGGAQDSIKEGESFVEYVKRINSIGQDSPNKEGGPNLIIEEIKQILKAAEFCQLLGYVKEKNAKSSAFERRHLLGVLLPHILLPNRASGYRYIEWSKGADLKFNPKRLDLPWRIVAMCIRDFEYSSQSMEQLNDFFVHFIIDDMENQLLNGSGEGRELRGMLRQENIPEIEGDLMTACLRAIDGFCKHSGRAPSALVLSARQNLCLMRNLYGRGSVASVAGRWSEAFSRFADIPVALSDFMPDDKIMLANLAHIDLISKELEGLGEIHSRIGETWLTYTYCCNIAIKDPKSVMVFALPENCLSDASDLRGKMSARAESFRRIREQAQKRRR